MLMWNCRIAQDVMMRVRRRLHRADKWLLMRYERFVMPLYRAPTDGAEHRLPVQQEAH